MRGESNTANKVNLASGKVSLTGQEINHYETQGRRLICIDASKANGRWRNTQLILLAKLSKENDGDYGGRQRSGCAVSGAKRNTISTARLANTLHILSRRESF